jgi:hypothetical protein
VNGKIWTPVNVNIQSNIEFRISLQVTSTDPSTYLALDDIIYRPGLCNSAVTVPPVTTLPQIGPGLDLGCNFDLANLCNWKNNPTLPWSINHINLQLLPMMPSVDHSKQSIYGRYAYVIHTVGAPVPRMMASMTATDNAIPNYKGRICVSLWYYMRTNAFAQFKVTIKSPGPGNPLIVWRLNDHGEKWNLLRFEANEISNGYQFNLWANVMNGNLYLHKFFTF